jgi:hypothetical protein
MMVNKAPKLKEGEVLYQKKWIKPVLLTKANVSGSFFRLNVPTILLMILMLLNRNM